MLSRLVFTCVLIHFLYLLRMWCYGELDNKLNLSNYGRVEFEDTSNFQPTFMTQGLDSLLNESRFSSWSDRYGEILSPTGMATDCTTICTSVEPNQSINGFLNHPTTLPNPDISGTDSNACCVEHSVEKCREMKDNVTRRYCHSSSSSSLQSSGQHFSPRNNDLLDALQTGICLFPGDVYDCLHEMTNSLQNSSPVQVGWVEEENKPLVKQEFNPTPQSSDINCLNEDAPGWLPTINYSGINSSPSSGIPYSVTTLEQNCSTSSSQKSKVSSSGLHLTGNKCRKLTPEKNMLRKAKVARYLEKRKKRNWSHTIRYASRKAYAENRPRIKGRFARQEEVDALQKKLKIETN